MNIKNETVDRNMARNIVIGMAAAMAMSGVDISINQENKIVYLTIPNKSYEYELPNSVVKSSQDYAKSLKDKLLQLGFMDNTWRVKYKEKDIYWTKEMGDINYRAKYPSIMNMIKLMGL